ncbi:hypothetical protein V2J09_017208 [Rumex salicifolius]
MEGIRSPIRKSPKREEDRLILLHNRNDAVSESFTSNPELLVKVDSVTGENTICRDSSYDFRNDAVSRAAINPRYAEDDDDESVEFDFSKHKGKAEVVDLESQSQNLSPVSESPNEHGKITPRTFEKVRESELVQRRSTSVEAGASRRPEDEVMTCSSNASFRRKSALLKTKTKSRLLDPREDGERRSGWLKRSGLLHNPNKNDENFLEEDDPFLDDDLPDEYKKMRFSFFSVIQLLSLILIVASLVCSLAIPFLRNKSPWGMELWKWEVMVLVLICGGLVSGWLIRIVVFFIERNFLLRKRVLYFVYGLRSSVQNCLWLGWVLLAWILILDQKVEKETHSKYLPYITRILVCFLIGTIIWLFKTLLVKVLAMSFHVSAFFDRIQEALFNQYVIETLSGPPLIEIQRIHEEEERVLTEVEKLQNAGASVPADLRANCMPNSGMQRSPPVIGKSPRFSSSTPMSGKVEREEAGIRIDRLHRFNQKNISAWNMKRLMNIVRKGVLSTLDEELVDSNMEDETSMHIRSEKQAKSAAKRIFNNVARPESKYICEEDLMRFMRDDEALKAMDLFEGSSESNGISKRALKNWVVNVFRERRALALSLNDTKTAVNKLHQLLNVLVGFIVVIIWLMILGVPISHFLLLISSQLLLLTFIFGNTFKTTFEAIIFLFVMHPFDVGDRCEIDEVQMIVEEMNLLTTVFLRYDNRKIIYPNSILATKPISNYYRSPDMGDAIDFCVHTTRRNIVMRDVEDMNRLKFSIWLSHTMNHQDMGERWARRALLVEEMLKIFKDLDIEYRMLPMDINVRTLPSLVSDRLPSNWSLCSK